VHRLLPDIIKAGEEAPRRAAGLVQQLPPANLSTLQVGACSFVVVLVALCGRLDGQPGAGRCACQSVRAGVARCVQTGLSWLLILLLILLLGFFGLDDAVSALPTHACSGLDLQARQNREEPKLAVVMLRAAPAGVALS